MQATTIQPQDLLHALSLISQYQHGICEDMRPFLSLPLRLCLCDEVYAYRFKATVPVSPFQTIADVVESVLPLWLNTHGMERLGTLFACLERAREPVLLWAASKARIDVLAWGHDKYDLQVCSRSLLLAGVGQLDVLVYLHGIGYGTDACLATIRAAIHGHASSLAYLLSAGFPQPTNWLDDNTVAGMCFWGHRNTLELILPQIVQDEGLLRLATTAAAAHNHLDMANWLYDQLLHLDFQLVFYDDAIDESLYVASRRGHLEGLEWLLDRIVVPTDELGEPEHGDLKERCLGYATLARQRPVVDWLVPKVSSSSIVSIYLHYDDDGSMLNDVVDSGYDLDERTVVENMLRWSSEKLQRVLDTFDTFQQHGSTRTNLLKKCLYRVVMNGMVAHVPWLVACLDPADIRDVVCSQKALCLGLLQGGVPMLDLFESHCIHLTSDEMDDAMFTILRSLGDSSVLPNWLRSHDPAIQLANEDTIARWLVVRRGGLASVIGVFLPRLAQSKKTILQFKALFNAWEPLVDDEEKIRVLTECLRRAKNVDILYFVESLVPANPKLFAIMATTRHLGSFRRVHVAFAQSVHAEELLRMESEALICAAATGQRGIAQFLQDKIGSKNNDAVALAQEQATGNTVVSDLLWGVEN
ncbi:Aste57867_24144 [Aphanomyces stellatus]|uniref:Aste57867_24144 protein n=1 Tax=Aphanomyces stellatus TaxID=120398 RepID=A0A485KAK6_9STRA|nr:hypothetical protein As57867_024070 [Aphanomyces stellatus]KAF0715283.1 hypothetical protein As57867_003441 [Aphanomyces stellatus]KAF0715299.1 hypothetical protein As57867_003457 [Aphanomyces stellatus]VFT80617.1 Aste57867_3451 [Aphanomyces stellatus]VFT80633.1 Aste57867_3467 [Aphanomyces stellatus]